jgi:hypothetical protein
LGEVKDLSGCKIVWEFAVNMRFLVEGSADGNAWNTLLDRTAGSEKPAELQTFDFQARARFVRVSIQGGPGWAGFRECEIFGKSKE